MTNQRLIDLFSCEDYFESEYRKTGYWSAEEGLMLVVADSEIEEISTRDGTFLIVGRPGVDGLSFGYRQGMTGLWAYHPIEQSFSYMSNSVAELVSGWTSGELSV